MWTNTDSMIVLAMIYIPLTLMFIVLFLDD